MGMRTNLECRRIAAHHLNAWSRGRHLGTKALVFNAEQFEDWEVLSDWQVNVLHRDRLVAQVEIYEAQVIIIVNDIVDLIREEHLGEFNPLEHGIEPDNREYAMGGKYNDVEDSMPYDPPPHMDLPERRVMRHYGGRRPIVISSR